MCQFLSSCSEILSGRKVLNLAFLASCQLYFQLLNSLLGFTLCHEICDSKEHHDTGWLWPRSAKLRCQVAPLATGFPKLVDHFVQRRASSVPRPVLPGCRVISSLRWFWSCILSKRLQLPTDIEMNFVNFCPLHIWIPVVKFILQFTQELLWIMFCFRNITSIFPVRTGKPQHFRSL